MKKGSFILWISLLAVSSAGIAFCISYGKWGLLVLCGFSALLSGWKLLRLYGETGRKVKYLLDSVRSGDFSFNFASGRRNDNIYINRQLNEIRDIIRKAREDAVSREKYYELILDSIKTGVIATDEKGNVYQSNDAARKIFGLEVFTNVAQTRSLSPRCAESLLSIKPGEKSNVPVINEKGEYNISMHASTVFVGEKSLKVVVVSDINSELAEKELDSWQRLIRVMTHEIMNSLSPITSLSSSLMEICPDKDSDMAKGLATINSTGRSLISFIDDYRRFTHLPVPRKKAFLLSELIGRVIALQNEEARYVNVSVEPEDIMLYADEDLIGQVLMNVIKNAFGAMEGMPSPAVDIRARLDADENPTVDITDIGPAIQPDSVENIFMPFYTTKPNGSGIGLSLSRQIMRLHDGSIRLTSNLPGRVTFTLKFE
ncbi:MAG: ATP-binding protein [Bacteroidales bacterium]|nr:ATP-binding protein [Bacteroidales bacterium]MCI2122178.1 ATP-binding protein [Bacteroidales bacterium]MCI2145167.1 ATP-binding protein [Bacteroidales bacterium]